MSIGTARQAGAAQTLIDARLDTIDRMLLGRVSRGERLAIVAEVESQIHEWLSGRDAESLSRDDVLAVLARLDPPEAYLPEEESETSPARSPRPGPAARGEARPGSLRAVAKASGILGLSAVALAFLSPLFFVLGELSGSEFVMYSGCFGGAGLVLSASLLGLALGLMGRREGAWAVIGLVTSPLALLFLLVAGMALALAL